MPAFLDSFLVFRGYWLLVIVFGSLSSALSCTHPNITIFFMSGFSSTPSFFYLVESFLTFILYIPASSVNSSLHIIVANLCHISVSWIKMLLVAVTYIWLLPVVSYISVIVTLFLSLCLDQLCFLEHKAHHFSWKIFRIPPHLMVRMCIMVVQWWISRGFCTL
jgi:hypothetical protein